MAFQVELDKESKELLKEFMQEIKIMNEHLADLKEMVASTLGFKVK